jgi:hypothetical protein
MSRLLPPLHEGHAPIFLHLAFEDALDAYGLWRRSQDEPVVEVEGNDIPISSLFGRMRTCTDLLPGRIRDEVNALLGDRLSLEANATYAEAAIAFRSLCVARLKSTAN